MDSGTNTVTAWRGTVKAAEVAADLGTAAGWVFLAFAQPVVVSAHDRRPHTCGCLPVPLQRIRRAVDHRRRPQLAGLDRNRPKWSL